MLSERKFIDDSYNVFVVVWIIVSKLLEYLGLYKSLLVEAFLVPENLESYILLLLVVKTLKHLSKTTFSKLGNDFKPI